jgi:hypothetical protein
MGFTQYLSEPLDKVLHSYATVGYDLAALETELGVLRSEQAREKALAWEQCDSSSTTTRDRYASQQALSHTTELLVMEGQAEAKRIEFEFIRWVLSRRTV